jgi:N-acetylated-alpha-linked acidic dipeptidase
MEALGSGSDYTAFLDFAGVPSVNLGFGDEGGSGVYHSIYDDFFWFTHFCDTHFVYSRALAQTAGTAVMRLADAEVIPYEFTGLSDIVQEYNEDLQKLVKQKRQSLLERRREIEEHLFALTSDPRYPIAAPEQEPIPPELNFAPLLNAADELKASADKYQKAFAQAQATLGDPAQAAAIEALNGILIQAEHKLTDSAGLPRRSWYKHLLYAPGTYSGYGAKTMPGAREGIESGRYEEAEQEIARIAKAIKAECDLIDSATKALGGK